MISRTARRGFLIFPVTVFLIHLNSAVFCESLYYRSNSFGMLHERVEEQDIAHLEYVMVIDHNSQFFQLTYWERTAEWFLSKIWVE